MTNAHGAALWGRVTDILLGHITDDYGVMHFYPLSVPSNELRQQSEYWFSGYCDPAFYNYQLRGGK